MKITRAFISDNGDYSEERSSRLLNGKIVLIIKYNLIPPQIIHVISLLSSTVHFFMWNMRIHARVRVHTQKMTSVLRSLFPKALSLRYLIAHTRLDVRGGFLI